MRILLGSQNPNEQSRLNNEVKNRFLELGAEPAMKSPLQLGDYIKSEMKKWGKVVKEAGIKID